MRITLRKQLMFGEECFPATYYIVPYAVHPDDSSRSADVPIIVNVYTQVDRPCCHPQLRPECQSRPHCHLILRVAGPDPMRLTITFTLIVIATLTVTVVIT